MVFKENSLFSKQLENISQFFVIFAQNLKRRSITVSCLLFSSSFQNEKQDKTKQREIQKCKNEENKIRKHTKTKNKKTKQKEKRK